MIKRYLGAFMLAFAVSVSVAQNPTIPLYVGTYTTPNGSQGIYEFTFDPKTGDAQLIGETKSPNPSFIAKRGDLLLATNEMTDGSQTLSAFRIGDKQLSLINALPTGGSAPCHVVMDQGGKYAVVSNYLGGALDLYALNADGSLREKTDTKLYQGSSVNKNRQEASHIHSAFFGKDSLLYVSDLGADKIYMLAVEQGDRGYTFQEKGEITVPAGSGPRHLAIHPNGKLLYSLSELTADIHVFEKKKNTWSLVQTLSMNAPGFAGKNGAADIKLSQDGKFLYATDRVDANTIATFAVNRKGKLTQKQVISVMGRGPRNFNFSPDERFILVGNQLTDEIVVFARDAKKGLLTDTGKRIKASKPVCILF